MHSKRDRSEAEQEQILCAYQERPSMRGLARLYRISRNSLKNMLKKGSGTAYSQREPLACGKR